VKEALGKFNVAPSIDFDTTDSIDIPVAGGSGVGMPEMPKVTFNPNYNPFSNGGGGYNPQPRSVSRNWKELFDERNEGVGMKNEELDRAGLFGSRIEVEEENKVKMFVDKGSQTFDSQFLTQDDSLFYKNRYLCVSMKSGLMMVDVQRAFARIYYDSLLTQVEKSSGVSQKLLFPEVLELSLEDKCLFTEIELELKAVGFEIAEFGKSMYRIEGVPAMISEGADVLRMLENIIGEIKVSGCEVSRKVHQIIANTISENASSLRVGRTMTADERNALLAQLFASSNPNYAPDGRKIVNTLSDDVIESMF
jgi:DNA mismatch repair protein MutL